MNLVQSRSEDADRKLIFWEVYVDEGNLSKFLEAKRDATTKVFKQAEWDFDLQETQDRFLELMDKEQPHHVMMAPECRLWSPMQNMNYRTPGKKKDPRRNEEDRGGETPWVLRKGPQQG